MKKRTIPTTLIAVLLLLAPTLLWAGANETPGEGGKPHKFGSFMANSFEFGTDELAIFHKYVVGHQHYAMGPHYEDNKRDTSFGGGGLWNFFEFISDNNCDVMFMSSHGGKTPRTMIVSYEHTTAGYNAREAEYDYYKNIFPPGTIAAYNSKNDYSIQVYQPFYTNYFMTPQAMAWWSTCYSAKLSMTGVAEARAYLGYDKAVYCSKCECDEKNVLLRMDGQQGQQFRPLQKASEGINSICPPGGARLIVRGKLNTVLSPSVVDHAPTMPVCSSTPGFLKFDTTMDTSVDPAQAIVVVGAAFLTNQAWAGDDKLTFTVNPTTLPALIFYYGEENFCRSKANHARLDGNTNPIGSNAKGPNRDNYVWNTYCPSTPPSQPSTPSTPASPCTPSTPGSTTRVPFSVSNGTGTTTTVTVTVTDNKGWCTPGSKTTTLAPDGVDVIYYDFEIPVDAVAGDVDPYTVEVTSDSGFPPFTTSGQVVVDGALTATLIGNHRVKPGYQNQLEMKLENQSDLDVNLVNLAVQGESGWTVQSPDTTAYFLEAGEGVYRTLLIDVPPGLPQGEMHSLQVTGDIGGIPTDIASLQVSVGLPLTVKINDIIDLVPAKADAIMDLEIHSFDPSPLTVDYLVSDSNGLSVTVDGNPMIDPMGITPVIIHVTVPEDQSLVGVTGDVTLTITEPATGMEMTELVEYVIEDPLEIQGTESPAIPVYTGGPPDQSFSWDFTLRNRCDIELTGDLVLTSDVSSPTPIPFALSPGAEAPVAPVLTIPEDYPACVQPVVLDATTSQSIGNRHLDLELQINTPVTAQVIRRGWSGEAGDVVTVQTEVQNLRPDKAMSFDYQWLDTRNWLQTPAFGSMVLAPMEIDTLEAEFRLVPLNKAFADSDSVSVVVSMIYDSGQPATTQADTWLMVNHTASDVHDVPLPPATKLDANYPNPFNPQTLIRFNLAETGPVQLTVHDLVGRLVATIYDGQLGSGYHERLWNGRAADGSEAASGVYFIRLKTKNGVWAQKAMLIR